MVDAHGMVADDRSDESDGPRGGGTDQRAFGSREVGPPVPRIEPDGREPAYNVSIDRGAQSCATRSSEERCDHGERDDRIQPNRFPSPSPR
jgi:hypothetical protein